MNRLAQALAGAALCLAGMALPAGAEFVAGADLSLLQFIQDHGVQYKEAGQVKDPLLIFKDHGCIALFDPSGNRLPAMEAFHLPGKDTSTQK